MVRGGHYWRQFCEVGPGGRLPLDSLIETGVLNGTLWRITRIIRDKTNDMILYLDLVDEIGNRTQVEAHDDGFFINNIDQRHPNTNVWICLITGTGDRSPLAFVRPDVREPLRRHAASRERGRPRQRPAIARMLAAIRNSARAAVAAQRRVARVFGRGFRRGERGGITALEAV
jgi:hypothetical protein